MKRRSANKQKIVLGITGSFGSGKSTVAKMFRVSGARIIDADKIARCLARPGSCVYRRLVAGFGKGVTKSGGELNRKKLAAVVFKDKGALKKLNRIIHPAVISEIKKQLRQHKEGVIVLDVPLLIESGLRKLADRLLVVKASQKNQIKRLVTKRGISRSQALERIKAQLPISVKVRMADFVIDNNLSLKNTLKQVKQIRRRLWRN